MHGKHVAALEAPTAPLNVPATHDTHEEAPSTGPYVPATQFRHVKL